MDKMKLNLSLLGLDENASVQDVKKRYYELAKQFHPDVNKNAKEEFVKISKAYNYLMKQMKLDEETVDFEIILDESVKKTGLKQLAKKFYINGVKYFKEGDINNAISMFEEACRRDNNFKYKRWLIKCYMQKDRRLFDAKQLCLELIKEESWNAENYVLLGDIYNKKKLNEVAKEYYQKAVELGYPKEKLKGKLPGSKKKFFIRFFKK